MVREMIIRLLLVVVSFVSALLLTEWKRPQPAMLVVSARDPPIETAPPLSSSSSAGTQKASPTESVSSIIPASSVTIVSSESSPPPPRIYPDPNRHQPSREVPLLRGGMRRLSRPFLNKVVEHNFVYLCILKMDGEDPVVVMWKRNIIAAGVHNFVVGAFEASYVRVEEMFGEKHTYAVDPPIPPAEKLDLHNGMKLSVFARIESLLAILELGIGCTLVDSDAMFAQNPTPVLLRYPQADILATTDSAYPTEYGRTHELEDPTMLTYDFNIGFCYFKPGPYVKRFVQSWSQTYFANQYLWDQRLFGDMLRSVTNPYSYPGKWKPQNGSWAVEGLEYGLHPLYGGKVVTGMLSSLLFRNGFVMHGSLPERLDPAGREPYLLHPTAHQDKAFAAREQLSGRDDPEYYNAPEGYLTFDLDIPELGVGVGSSYNYVEVSRKLPTDLSVDAQRFWRAVLNKQLAQIGNAAATAKWMGRILVLPPLIVPTVMKGWLSPYSFVGNESAQRPIKWSRSFVWLVNTKLVNSLPKEKRYIKIREYSFMRNPLLPAEVRGGVKQMGAANFTEVSAKEAGEKFVSDRVLHFSSMERGFSFAMKEARTDFELKTYRPFFREQRTVWAKQNQYSFLPSEAEMADVRNLTLLMAEARAMYYNVSGA